MATDAQKKATQKYRKANQKTYTVCCHNVNDYDIIEIMQEVTNKNEFLRAAIRFYAAQNPEKIK